MATAQHRRHPPSTRRRRAHPVDGRSLRRSQPFVHTFRSFAGSQTPANAASQTPRRGRRRGQRPGQRTGAESLEPKPAPCKRQVVGSNPTSGSSNEQVARVASSRNGRCARPGRCHPRRRRRSARRRRWATRARPRRRRLRSRCGSVARYPTRVVGSCRLRCRRGRWCRRRRTLRPACGLRVIAR
jgi:hypothetical protein